MTTQAELCDICGQPKSSGLTGSFTQWVNSCRCEVLDNEKSNVQICGLCGKQLDAGNTGSFTQWVLQPQNCTCADPVVLKSNGDDGASANSEESKSASSRQPNRMKVEIGDLDASNFPVSRYKPISMLGMGGGGLVYLCFDKHLRKNVAVKILRVTQPEQIVQFQAEAKVTAKFKHPNIVSILDFGSTDTGAPFMVLEYVEGKSLDVLIQERGPLPELVAAELFIQIAEAIQKGHEYGIFHRDIKSSNIIISQSKNNAQARVIDFGIAMVASTENVDFHGKHLVGTPKYMSPDQIAGRTFDARSDLYSFGCVMYETLMGRLPFSGNAMALLEKHANAKPPAFAEMSPDADISQTMERVVLRCLEKNPDARYQSFSDLKSALQNIAKDDLLSASSVQRVLAEDNLVDESKTSNEITESEADSRNKDGSKYGISTSGGKVRPDQASQLILALLILLGVGLISFVGYLLLRPDETEDSKILSSADRGTPDQHLDAAGRPLDEEDSVGSFDNFHELAPLNAQALKLEKAFKYAASESAYTRAISLDEGNSRWYRSRGLSRMYQGKFEEALGDFNTAVRLQDSDDNFRARAEYYMNAGNYTKAEADIRSAILKGPNAANNFIVQARINSDMDDNSNVQLERAMRATDRALRLEPERIEAQAQRLIVEARLKKDKSFIEKTSREIAAKGSNNAFALYCMARYSELTGDWNSALKWVSRAISLNPTSWKSYELRADTLKQLALEATQGKKVQYDEQVLSAADCKSRAMSDYYKATSLNPLNAKLLVEVAKFHRELNQVESEVKYLSQAIDLEPNQADLYRLRADAKHRAVMNEDAVEDCETAIALGEINADVYLLKANSLVELNRPEEAERAFSQSIKLAPANAEVYLYRAKLRSQRREYAKAIEDYEKVLQIRSGDEDALAGKRLALEEMNKSEDTTNFH